MASNLAKTHIKYMIKTDSLNRERFEELVSLARQGKISTDRVNKNGFYSITPGEHDDDDIYVFVDVDIMCTDYTTFTTEYRGSGALRTSCSIWQQFYMLMEDGTEFYYLDNDESKAKELILYIETGIVPEWASQSASNAIVTDPDELVF